MSNENQSPKIKNIEVGKFYFIHDGSKTGHPGLIVWKDDVKNLYIAIKFGTTKNDDNEVLSNKISLATTNYIYKRLFVGKRKDFGKNELCEFHITEEIRYKYAEILKNNLKYSKAVANSQRDFLDKNKDAMFEKIKK